MKIIIKRSRWIRGDRKSKTGAALRNSDPRPLQCCLGFACAAAGVKPAEMRDTAMPDSLLAWGRCSARTGARNKEIAAALRAAKLIRPAKWAQAQYTSTLFADRAAEINDNPEITEQVREEKLTKLFAKYGHTLHFVD